MALLGIDLGTTNSVAAIEGHRDGRIERVVSMPSVVAFLPNRAIRVGEVARRRRAIDGANTIFSSKRIIGRRFDSAETQSFIDHYPLEVVDERGWPAFQTRMGVLSPTRISASILEGLLERAEVLAEDCEVVITVPASFGDAQLVATRQAAEWAGLGHARLMDEPSATALAYLHADVRCRRGIVYDLGGGTFDCAVLDCSAGTPRVLAHASDLTIGGDDIDQHLATWVAQYILEKHNWDLTNYAEVYNRLLACCESAKIELSSADTADVQLSQIDPECPTVAESVTISRGVLDQLCQDLVRRTFITCDTVLRESGLRPLEIDAVFLAGGATHMPMVQKSVETYFDRTGHAEIDPTEVVALGARVSAGSVFG